MDTNADPVRIGSNAGAPGREFGGQIDQVRIWDKVLTQTQIQARAHRTVNVGSVTDLVAGYRFDTGSGTTAYDVTDGSDGTFQSDPQWTDPSGASVGRQSTVLTDGTTPVTVSPQGASGVKGTLTSGTGLADDATVYRWGTETGAPVADGSFPKAVQERSNVAWGVWPRGSAQVDLTVSYGDASGITKDGSTPVILLRRDEPGTAWSKVTTNVTHAKSNDKFTVTGVTQAGQYAVANQVQVDLALSGPADAELQDGESVTQTFTLNNNSGTDGSGVTVGVTVPSGVTLESSSASSGTYSSGTWDVGSLAAGNSVTLDLTVSLSGSAPQDLSAQVSALDQADPDASNDGAATRLVPVPYGSGSALTLDGTDDYLSTGAGGDDFGLVNESFTIEAWVKMSSLTGTIVGMDGGSNNNTLHLQIFSDGAVKFGFFGNDLNTSSGVATANVWQHFTFVYDASKSERYIYRNGKQVASETGVSADFQGTSEVLIGRWGGSNYFDGQIDQVRVWQGALSQQQVQARAHRSADLDNVTGLVAGYRFDAGSGTTAYDVAGGFDGTFQSDPQWTDPSGASVGRRSTALTDGTTPVTVGPTGSNVQGTLTSGTGLADDATVYRWGIETGATVGDDAFTASVKERSNVAWGIWPRGSAQADLTVSYGDASGITKDGSTPVILLRRDAADLAWEKVTTNVSHDNSNDQFTVTGVTQAGQYAVGNELPEVDLALSRPSDAELQDGESVTQTFTLDNTSGSNDGSGVTVDVTVPTGLTLESTSASSGSYSSGTWDVGSLAAGASATLDLTVSLSGSAPKDLSAQVSALDQLDPTASNDAAATRLVPVPYGSGSALTLDGTDDHVTTGAGGDDLGLANESFTIEARIKLDVLDAYRVIVATEGAGVSNEKLHIQVGPSGGIDFNFWDNDLGAPTGTVTTGEWMHLSFVYDASSGDRFIYKNGVQVASDNASSDFKGTGNLVIGQLGGGSKFWDGQIDQVRVWQGALSQQQVQARAYRSADLDNVTGLPASYRFDANSGTTAYDVAGGFDGTFQNGPQWTTVSGATVGRNSAAVTSGSQTVGPSDGTVAVSNVSTSGSDALAVYQYGRTGGSLIDGTTDGEDFSGVSANQRLHVVWGLNAIGSSPEADVTFDFSGIDGVNDPSSVVLLKRDGSGRAWTDVTSNWTRSNETFSKTNVSSFSQYAVGGDAQSLPVELASFEGQATNKETVTLTWQTASETGNAGFHVQRRAEATTESASTAGWTTVGRVDGAGTTSKVQTYRFKDANLPYDAGALRYRLKQVDTDGTTSFTEPITVARGAVEDVELLGTFPNPARSQATVRFAIPEGRTKTVSLRLYDVLGRAVRTVRSTAEAGRHAIQLDTEQLGSGVYFLRLRAGTTLKTQRLTVVK